MALRPRLDRLDRTWSLDVCVATPNAETPDATLVMKFPPMEYSTLEMHVDGEYWILMTEEEKQERITGIVGAKMCSREKAEAMLHGGMNIQMIDDVSDEYGINFSKIRQCMLDWWDAITLMVNLAS